MRQRSAPAALIACALAAACSAPAPSVGPTIERVAVADAAAPDADATTPDPRAYPLLAGPGTVADGVAHLNTYRALAGLPPVTLDEPSSKACAGHLAYLVWEQHERRGGEPGLTHDEPDHANPSYAPAHERAARDADLAYGTTNGQDDSFGRAVDRWMNALYHRRPLLDPGLVRVGAASDAGYGCLDFRAPGNTRSVRAEAPVMWPADGMTGVPTEFAGSELPCPTKPRGPLATNGHDCPKAGYIASVTFYGWGHAGKSAIQSLAAASLTAEPSGDAVPLAAVYAGGVAGHDPAPGYATDTIALVPAAKLSEGTTYRVAIDATVDGAERRLAWRFTTGRRGE